MDATVAQTVAQAVAQAVAQTRAELAASMRAELMLIQSEAQERAAREREDARRGEEALRNEKRQIKQEAQLAAKTQLETRLAEWDLRLHAVETRQTEFALKAELGEVNLPSCVLLACEFARTGTVPVLLSLLL
ncbi:MAG: hypothetical protein P4N59_11175 [Negativicutes bacterium]|nr:hypothetical protein [Negativicutes bacterium]